MKREDIANLRTALSRCFIFLFLAVSVYLAVSLYDIRVEVINDIDRRLELAALAIPAMLAPDFHDRAVTPYSIPYEEELRNRKVLDDYVENTGFSWVYTLVEDGGRFFFSAPTVTEKEAAERTRWYYYPYPEIPDEFRQAYRSGKPVWVSYTDRWGTFRSVAYPMKSEGGRTYLACADVDISLIWHGMLRKGLVNIVVAAFFILVSMPFCMVYHRYAGVLEKRVEELERYSSELEALVRDKAEKLGEAMDRVDDLSVRDSLTGLYNRSHGMSVLERMCDSDGSGGWLALVDLDDFKRINEVIGHHGGDDVLSHVGETVKGVLAEGELASRYGGDEFLVLYPPADKAMIECRTEKLRKAVVELGQRYGWPLSVSIGIARIAKGVSPRLLLSEARKDIGEDSRTALSAGNGFFQEDESGGL